VFYLEFVTKQIVAAILAAILLSVPAGLALKGDLGGGGRADADAARASSETTAARAAETVVVSKSGKAYDGKSVYIDVRTVFQYPELPTGCEITALSMVLNYYGFETDKTDLAKNYLPQSKYMVEKDGKVYINNFRYYFLGDPFGKGWGCYSNAIANAAAAYVSDNADNTGGGSFKVSNISGSDPDGLYDYLKEGVPVIVWGTIGLEEPVYNYTYYDILTEERLDWFAKEHCFVLTGFDLEKGVVTVNDPLSGIYDAEKALFELRYAQMDKQAVVISVSEVAYGKMHQVR
jgi:uncharacterized protein YvpB